MRLLRMLLLLLLSNKHSSRGTRKGGVGIGGTGKLAGGFGISEWCRWTLHCSIYAKCGYWCRFLWLGFLTLANLTSHYHVWEQSLSCSPFRHSNVDSQPWVRDGRGYFWPFFAVRYNVNFPTTRGCINVNSLEA